MVSTWRGPAPAFTPRRSKDELSPPKAVHAGSNPAGASMVVEGEVDSRRPVKPVVAAANAVDHPSSRYRRLTAESPACHAGESGGSTRRYRHPASRAREAAHTTLTRGGTGSSPGRCTTTPPRLTG